MMPVEYTCIVLLLAWLFGIFHLLVDEGAYSSFEGEELRAKAKVSCMWGTGNESALAHYNHLLYAIAPLQSFSCIASFEWCILAKVCVLHMWCKRGEMMYPCVLWWATTASSCYDHRQHTCRCQRFRQCFFTSLPLGVLGCSGTSTIPLKFNSMSARVVPYRQLQPEQLFISATRAQQRVLKNYEIVARQEVSLYERAANKAQQLWDRIDGKSTCMWLDNVYIKHFVLNPFYSDGSHNATATCLLRTVRLNNFPGHRTLREMRLAVPALAFKIKESFQALKDSIATALSADRSWIRIPLDIVRDVVQR